MKAQIFVERWGCDLFEREYDRETDAINIAKSFYIKYKTQIKWVCAYTERETLYEYIDPNYSSFLEALYTRNPNKVADQSQINSLLTGLKEKNPPLFDKYLEFLADLKKKT